jgi:hypothetical protein
MVNYIFLAAISLGVSSCFIVKCDKGVLGDTNIDD